MAVGGFFLIFEPIPGATRPVSRSTGETSRTAPLSGHRRPYVTAVRQSTRRRRDGGPGRLEQLGRSRARPADRTGRRRRGAQRSDGVERSEPSLLRHRRDACDVTPRLAVLHQWPLGNAVCVRRGTDQTSGHGRQSWHRCVIMRPLRGSRDRCGSVELRALSGCLMLSQARGLVCDVRRTLDREDVQSVQSVRFASPQQPRSPRQRLLRVVWHSTQHHTYQLQRQP